MFFTIRQSHNSVRLTMTLNYIALYQAQPHILKKLLLISQTKKPIQLFIIKLRKKNQLKSGLKKKSAKGAKLSRAFQEESIKAAYNHRLIFQQRLRRIMITIIDWIHLLIPSWIHLQFMRICFINYQVLPKLSKFLHK